MENEIGYTMKVVARRTGLTPHAIRVWERRYGAVQPVRTATNRRLYSSADIERLSLLKKATAAGHSIGQIAGLSNRDLAELLVGEFDLAPRAEDTSKAQGPESTVEALLSDALDAIRDLDADGLQHLLTRAAVSLSQPVLIEKMLLPLLRGIGDLWHGGELRIAHEHLASAVIRTFMGGLARGGRSHDNGPVLIVATPTGQLHEFGALMVAAAAASQGWQVRYLGCDLPAEEIAGAAAQARARAVALSIVYPADDPRLPLELRALGRYLLPGVALMAGGRAAASYAEALHDIGAVRLENLTDLQQYLASLRAASR